MKPIYARAGDTFFTRSNSLLGKAIRWGEQDCDEKEPSWTNHSGVVVADGWIGNEAQLRQENRPVAVVVEALWKTRRGPLKVNGTEVRVFRPKPAYAGDELQLFALLAAHYVGDTYGWWKLLGFLLKRATCGKIDITNFYFIDSRPICSYLAAHVNDAARKRSASWPGFGMDPDAADPDGMMDFCLNHPEFWEEVK